MILSKEHNKYSEQSHKALARYIRLVHPVKVTSRRDVAPGGMVEYEFWLLSMCLGAFLHTYHDKKGNIVYFQEIEDV